MSLFELCYIDVEIQLAACMHAHCHDAQVKWGRGGIGEFPSTHQRDCTFCTPQSFSALVTSNATDLCSVNSYSSGAPRAKRA